MGARGRARIEESLNWAAVAERFEAVFERMTSGVGPGSAPVH